MLAQRWAGIAVSLLAILLMAAIAQARYLSPGVRPGLFWLGLAAALLSLIHAVVRAVG